MKFIILFFILISSFTFGDIKSSNNSLERNYKVFIEDLKKITITCEKFSLKENDKIILLISDNENFEENENMKRVEFVVRTNIEYKFNVFYKFNNNYNYYIKIIENGNIKEAKVLKIHTYDSHRELNELILKKESERYAISKYGNIIAVNAERKIYFLKNNGEIINEVPIKERFITDIQFNPEDETEVFIYDVEKHILKSIKMYEEPMEYEIGLYLNKLLFSDDGKYFVTCEPSKFSLWKNGSKNSKLTMEMEGTYSVIKCFNDKILYIKNGNVFFSDFQGNIKKLFSVKGIKWYIDTETSGIYNKEKNTFFIASNCRVYEINMNGKIINSFGFPGMGFSQNIEGIFLKDYSKLILKYDNNLCIFNTDKLEVENVYELKNDKNNLKSIVSENGIIIDGEAEIKKGNIFAIE